MRKIAAILMASGFSSRYKGINKLLLPINGVPLARRTMELVCRSPLFAQRILVIADEDVAALAKELPLTVVYNKNPARGQCESIRLGVRAADADYYMFFPCDQPFLTEDILQKLASTAVPGCIVVPRSAGVSSTPTLFSAVFRDELLSLPDGAAGRSIISAHPETLLRVEINNGEVLMDIDSPEDLQRVLDLLSRCNELYDL